MSYEQMQKMHMDQWKKDNHGHEHEDSEKECTNPYHNHFKRKVTIRPPKKPAAGEKIKQYDSMVEIKSPTKQNRNIGDDDVWGSLSDIETE